MKNRSDAIMVIIIVFENLLSPGSSELLRLLRLLGFCCDLYNTTETI